MRTTETSGSASRSLDTIRQSEAYCVRFMVRWTESANGRLCCVYAFFGGKLVLFVVGVWRLVPYRIWQGISSSSMLIHLPDYTKWANR